jgi:DNA (cytosine-5)-methyltransferase 1
MLALQSDTITTPSSIPAQTISSVIQANVPATERLSYASNSGSVFASIELAEINHEFTFGYSFAITRTPCPAYMELPSSVGQVFATRADAIKAAVAGLRDTLRLRVAHFPELREDLNRLRGWLRRLLSKLVSKTLHSVVVTKPFANWTFFEAFSGIGVATSALMALGAECIGAAECDLNASAVFLNNHGKHIPIVTDVCAIEPDLFKRPDMLIGGFPCQPFSPSGKKMGLADPTRGSLLTQMVRLTKAWLPKAVILENVEEFATMENGQFAQQAMRAWAELGYRVSLQSLNASHFGLPQSRTRIFIVAIRRDVDQDSLPPFLFPKGHNTAAVVSDILETGITAGRIKRPMTAKSPRNSKSGIRRVGLIDNKNFQGYRVADPRGKGWTLCAKSGGLGANTGLYLIDGLARRLTPREAARMQGLPETFSLDTAESRAYQQLGNAIALPVIRAVALSLAHSLRH